MKLFKKIKPSKRGLTFTVDDQVIHVGSKYKYTFDKDRREVMISPSEAGYTVSKKKSGSNIKPLFDFRKKEIVDTFSSCQSIEIYLCEEGILCKGLWKTGTVKKGLQKITDIIKTPVWEIFIPNQVLMKQAAGMEGQLSFEDWFGFSVLDPVDEIQIQQDAKQIYTAFSVFCGAGMLDYSFMKAGVQFVYSSDIDPAAVRSHQANIPGPCFCADIHDIKQQDIPYSDIAIGGPSCKPFSSANRTKRGRAHLDYDLIDEYVRLIKEKDPSVFVVENVPEFATMADGEAVQHIYDNLSSSYDISIQKLNESDAGGYMDRDRVIIIGSKIGKIQIPQVSVLPKKTAGDALCKVDATWFNYNDRTSSREGTRKLMALVPEGGNWKDLPEDEVVLYRKKPFGPATHSIVMKKIDRNKPCPSLANIRKNLVISPLTNEGLSVAENSALMGFDKDFKFLGSLGEKQQQVANGVGRFTGKLIAETIKKKLDNFFHTRDEFCMA